MKAHVRSALFALAATLAPATWAQEFPTKPIRILTPAAPGGTTDLLARLFGNRLSEKVKQQVLVENRASATGVVAGELTANAAPDGYTLLLAYHQHTVNAALNVPMPYHPVNSFTPVTQLTSSGLLLVVNPNSPPRTPQEFIEWTRKNPNQSFGSAGIGSGGHMAGELYKLTTGTKAEHIPYKGTGPAMTDLLGGRFEYNFSGIAAGLQLSRSGKLRAIAVTNAKRIEGAPDIPAMAEALPGFEVTGWYGLIGPAKIPAPVLKRLNDELVAITKEPEIRKRILNDGSEPVGSDPVAFRNFMLNDMNKWIKVVKDGNVKVEGI